MNTSAVRASIRQTHNFAQQFRDEVPRIAQANRIEALHSAMVPVTFSDSDGTLLLSPDSCATNDRGPWPLSRGLFCYHRLL